MKVFTIADIRTECQGHGDYSKVETIRRQGPYETGEFPPVFRSKAQAKAYLKSMQRNECKEVVEMELIFP